MMFPRFLLLAVVLAASAPASVSAQECDLPDCPAGTTCYADSTSALNCLYSIPFNEAWAAQTITVLSTSLENFGFDALYHSTGPPYVINLDMQGELSNTQDMISAGDFASDLAFQEHTQALFQSTLDAHTRYQKVSKQTSISRHVRLSVRLSVWLMISPHPYCFLSLSANNC
jgi:hypothetical protein